MVYGYVRVSTENQRDNWSVDVQRERIKQFADSMGEKCRIYDEVGSGKNISARPEFSSLLQDLQKDTFPTKKVWVVEQTRLARNVSDADYISKLFQRLNVELYVNDNLVDLSTASNRLIYGIQAVVAAHEREQTGERIRRAKTEQIEDGSFVHSTLFGYSFKYNEDGSTHWYINKAEAKVIRMIFKMYCEGYSVHQIAQSLNKLGYKTKRNREFFAPSISKLLSHVEYFGKCHNREGEIIDSKIYSPILDMTREAFLQAKEVRAPIARKFKFLSTHVSGVVTCGLCGKRYYIHQRTLPNGQEYIRLAHQISSTHSCAQMPKYIPFDRTADWLDSIYRESFDDNDFLEFIISKDREMLPEYEIVEKEYLEIKRKHAVLVQQKSNLIEAVINGIFSKDEVKEKSEALDEEEKRVAYQLMTFSKKLDDLKHDIRTDDKFKKKYLEEYDIGSIEDKHIKLSSIIQSCVIADSRIVLTRIDEKEFQLNLLDSETSNENEQMKELDLCI